MLQDGHRGSVYVNAELVGSPKAIRTPETREAEVPFFYIGGDEGDSGSNATVTNFFLYNRPLSEDELKLVTKSEGSVCVGACCGCCCCWGFGALRPSTGRNAAGPLPPVGAICTSPRTLWNN
ncbi:trans-sialidase [Trypanosoma cruzi]|nr:trans-sialidase [Trypanosoma cruzi]